MMMLENLPLVRDYLRAAAQLYGRIPLDALYSIFASHNGDRLTAEVFCQLARSAQGPSEIFRIIGDDDIYRRDISVADTDRWLVHRKYCYATWDELFTLEYNQRGKMLHHFPKEQMLSYADPEYIPCTPQVCELEEQLAKCTQNLLPLSRVLRQALLLAMADRNAATFIEEMRRLGCRFDTSEAQTQMVHCYKQVYDTIPKPIHNGNSEHELVAVLNLTEPLKRYYLWFCPPTEKDDFYGILHGKPAELPPTGVTEHQRFLDRCMQCQTLPHRLFDPCHCGSGLYYTDCCGKR